VCGNHESKAIRKGSSIHHTRNERVHDEREKDL